MRKAFIALGLLGLTSIQAQEKIPEKKENPVEILKSVVDSINHQKWEQHTVDPDSLGEIKLVAVPQVKIDTGILPTETNQPKPVEEPIPITPYQVLKYPTEKLWFVFGQNSLFFNESAFSNWNAGGSNSIGFNAKVNYSLIYRHGRHFWENNVLLGYGLMASKGQSSRKTDDQINILSNYGYDLGKDFYFSSGIQFKSQFSPGFNYGATPRPHFSDRISRFMAPGYLNVGTGISYNPSKNFQVIFRPANGRFTFVLDEKLQTQGNYGLKKDGQSVLTEFGALLNVLYKIDVMKDFSFTNQLNLFSNYAFHPERVDLSYVGNINIRFNKYITTNISVEMLYDHDQREKLQLKQTLGVGLTYDLGIKFSNRPDKKLDPFTNKIGL